IICLRLNPEISSLPDPAKIASHRRMVVSTGKKRSSVERKKSPRYVSRSISETRKILLYFRKAESMRSKAVGGGIATVPSPEPDKRTVLESNRCMFRLVIGPRFLKHPRNHLFEGRVLNA